jgi:hypothetical protein
VKKRRHLNNFCPQNGKSLILHLLRGRRSLGRGNCENYTHYRITQYMYEVISSSSDSYASSEAFILSSCDIFPCPQASLSLVCQRQRYELASLSSKGLSTTRIQCCISLVEQLSTTKIQVHISVVKGTINDRDTTLYLCR